MTLEREERMRSIQAALITAACILVPSALHAQASVVQREFEEGDFSVSIAHDALTDANSSFILSIAENEEGGLGWKCMEDGLNVILVIGTYYAGDEDDDIIVQYRFDQAEPEPQEYWALLSGKEMAYIRMDRVAAFTARALTSHRVVVRAVDPYDNETRTFVISMRGLDRALRNLPCATGLKQPESVVGASST
jgi:hypothetical protein